MICLCQVARGVTSRIEGGGAMWLLSLVLFVCLSRGVLSGLVRLIALSYEKKHWIVLRFCFRFMLEVRL